MGTCCLLSWAAGKEASSGPLHILDDLGHILRGHDNSMMISLALGAVKLAHIHLSDEVFTIRALFRSVVFVQTQNDVAE